MAKIVIVGSGPAGVSAALYAARAGMDTTVISMGLGALQKAEQIQNYYGLEKPLSGMELYRRGIAGAKAVGAKFVTAEVVGLDYAAGSADPRRGIPCRCGDPGCWHQPPGPPH